MRNLELNFLWILYGYLSTLDHVLLAIRRNPSRKIMQIYFVAYFSWETLGISCDLVLYIMVRLNS